MYVLKSVNALALALFAFGGGLCGAAQTAQKKPPAVPAAKKTAPLKAAPKTAASPAKHAPAKPAVRGASSASVRSKTAAAARSRSTRAAASRNKAPVRRGQLTPTPDRYKEIQQALADKGYYQGTVTGAWGPESADALKRFQKDQNLTDTGKLDSLSLIALGLGPKRNLSSRSTTESRPQDDNRRPEGSERP
jgi:peptidoglycan hydrolase-like protein with peptidoglycan-binding domain